jgi:putative pyrimidine permease RutG
VDNNPEEPPMSSMFSWREVAAQPGVVVAPDERLPWAQTAALGVQHVIAMFGATVLAPILMGFDANVAILMSGIGTLIFFVVTGGRLPSYLGSSFAFIGVVIAATAYAGKGANANIGVALGGIIACGALYTTIGLVVMATGTGWIERLMPPVVTGAVVAVIGLNLAGIPIKNMAPTAFDAWMQALTFVCVGAVAVFTRGMTQRLLILVGLIVASLVYAVLTNGLGMGTPVDLGKVAAAAWFGAPAFAAPHFDARAMLMIAPVAIILVAENLGHVKAVSAMTGHNLDPLIGRAFVGDGVATMVSGGLGGTGVTTYAENIGVMAAQVLGHQDLLDRHVHRRRGRGHPARLLAQVRRADPGHSAGGDGRRVDRRLRPHRRGRRQDLGRQPRRLLRQRQPDRGGRDAGAGHR